MQEYDVKTLLLRELPELLEHDPQIRESIWRLVTPYFAPRQETESRFDRLLNELQRMREESERKWDEQRKESERKWDEQQRKWEEQQRKWDESKVESERRFQQVLAEIKRVDTKIDTKIGAIGARWGIDSETAFRNALRGILEDIADVQVIHVNEFDGAGEVFGRPDQIELDIVIRNGMLIVCEIKSSVSRSDVHVFERKVQFYERRHQRTATQKIIISPMVDPRAMSLTNTLGMRVYYNADDVVFDENETTRTEAGV